MDNTIGEPRVVAGGRGSAWWVGGWRLFAANVFTWIGMVIIYYIISILLTFVPIIGSVGQALLTPVFVGGIMLGCQSIERDGTLRVAHLFEGFQGEHFVPLMTIGAINIACFVAFALIGSIGFFGMFAGLAHLMVPGADPLDAMMGSLRTITGTGLLVGLIMLALGTAFAMLNWFAPALVALHGARGWPAMKASFSACLRNWVPFLVYGLIGMAVAAAFGALVVVASFAMLASALHGGGNTGMAAMFAFMGVVAVALGVVGLIVGPIVFGSTYTAYTDIFAGTEEQLPNPAYR